MHDALEPYCGSFDSSGCRAGLHLGTIDCMACRSDQKQREDPQRGDLPMNARRCRWPARTCPGRHGPRRTVLGGYRWDNGTERMALGERCRTDAVGRVHSLSVRSAPAPTGPFSHSAGMRSEAPSGRALPYVSCLERVAHLRCTWGPVLTRPVRDFQHASCPPAPSRLCAETEWSEGPHACWQPARSAW